MDKRKYMKPTCEVVTVNSLQPLLGVVSGTPSMRSGTEGGPALIGKRRNDVIREIDPWSWECVLWNQESNDVEGE
jgi:hypothetical protein